MKTHKNFTKEAIESIEKDILEWATSSTNLNKFICTRIWCIKDNIVITPLQLIDNDGKCPVCNGSIIDDKKRFIGDSTVLLKKGKSNNYWGSNEIPNDFIEDVKAKKYKDSQSESEKKNILFNHIKKNGKNILVEQKNYLTQVLWTQNYIQMECV